MHRNHQQYLAKYPAGYCGIGGTGSPAPWGLTDALAASRKSLGVDAIAPTVGDVKGIGQSFVAATRAIGSSVAAA
jgi:hypothetical protein